MHLATYISVLGLSLSLGVHGAALPRSRRSGRHNRFVLVRSPQTQQEGTDAASGAVLTTAPEVTDSSNSTEGLESEVLTGSNTTEAYGLTPSDDLSPVNNSTGYNTIPPALNLTDPAVSQVVSVLVPTSVTYPTFSYSAYEPAPTVLDATITSADEPSFTPSASMDPVDQAIQAAQSYALHQEMGSHMPTVTIELVMLPTQEPDGTWNYVVQVGTDGTATAVPSFVPAPTSIPAGDSMEQAPPAQDTPISPYIHTTAAAPAPVYPTEAVSAGEQNGSPGQGSILPTVSNAQNAWEPVPTSESYYVGQGYISAVSSDGRGAVTFAYSTTAPEMTSTDSSPAGATAWTSGRGQQHAYPWATASSDGASAPDATHSAWTSGRGQQHAYPWATASQDPTDAPRPEVTAWTSGRGQQHAYPWATQAGSVNVVPPPQETASADANGVIIATFGPVISLPASSVVSGMDNPWLVSATLSTKTSQASATAKAEGSASEEGSPFDSTASLDPTPNSQAATSASPVESGAITSGVPDQFSITATASAVQVGETSIGQISQTLDSLSASAMVTGSPDTSAYPEPSAAAATLGTQTIAVAAAAETSTSATVSAVEAESTTSVSESVTLAPVPSQTISNGTGPDQTAFASDDATFTASMSSMPVQTSLATESAFAPGAESATISATGSALPSTTGSEAVSATLSISPSATDSFTESASISSGEPSPASNSAGEPSPTSSDEAALSASSTESTWSSQAKPTTASVVEPTSASASGASMEDDSSFATETVTAWTTIDVTATSLAEATMTASSSATESSNTNELPYIDQSSTRETAPSATQTSTQATVETLVSSATGSTVASSDAVSTVPTATSTESSVLAVTSESSVTTSSSLPTTTADFSATSIVTPTTSILSTETDWTSATSATSTASSAQAASTDEAGIPYCEEGADGDWEEVWVDEDDVQPGWEILE